MRKISDFSQYDCVPINGASGLIGVCFSSLLLSDPVKSPLALPGEDDSE